MTIFFLLLQLYSLKNHEHWLRKSRVQAGKDGVGQDMVTRTQRKQEALGCRELTQGCPWSLVCPLPTCTHTSCLSTPSPSPPYVALPQFPFYNTECLAVLFGLPTTDHNQGLPLFQGTFSPFLSKGTLPKAARLVTSENEKQLSCCTVKPVVNSSDSCQPVLVLKLVTKQNFDQPAL